MGVHYRPEKKRKRSYGPSTSAKQVPVLTNRGNIMNLRDRIEEVAGWCEGEAELYEAGITVNGVLAEPGDWIHRRDDGSFYIVPQVNEEAA